MLTWSSWLRLRPWSPARTQQQVIEAEGVMLDILRRRALIDGYLVHLSVREAELLGVLMARAGQVVYRPALEQAAWGTGQASHRDLDRLLRRLGRRLELSPLSPVRLHRVGDTGYLFGSTAQAGGG